MKFGKLLLLVLVLAISGVLYADSEISQSTGIIGNRRLLGALNYAGDKIVGVLGLDSSGNTRVNAASGKSVVLQDAETTFATFTSTTSNIPPLKTTYEAVAAAGSSVSDAGALSGSKWIHQVTGADGTKGVKFVTATPIESVQVILNTTAAVLKVYGESGSTINGGSADAAFSALTGIKPIICVKTAALTYICA